MSDVEFSSVPDAFTLESECRARKTAPGVIGARTHTHVCREPVDAEARHEGKHECTCGTEW